MVELQDFLLEPVDKSFGIREWIQPMAHDVHDAGNDLKHTQLIDAFRFYSEFDFCCSWQRVVLARASRKLWKRLDGRPLQVIGGQHVLFHGRPCYLVMVMISFMVIHLLQIAN